jgi:hypothetical protein
MYTPTLFLPFLLFSSILFTHEYPCVKVNNFVTHPDTLPISTSIDYRSAFNRHSAISDQQIPMAPLDSIFSGGQGNGFGKSETTSQQLIVADSMYNGGKGTGFDQQTAFLSLFTNDSLYNGGNGNGFYQHSISNTMLYSIDSLYNGGIGRGESTLEQVLDLSNCGLVTAWTGTVSTTWEDPSNWNCGIVPGVNSIVLIPSGRPRYPVVNTSWEIKRLLLQPGSSIMVNTNVIFRINSQ